MTDAKNDENSIIHDTIITILRDPKRSLKDDPLNNSEIWMLLEGINDELTNNKNQDQIKLLQGCLKLIQSQIVYNS